MNIMVLHMGRSGGHAIIEWICQNLPGDVTFYNNCVKGWDDKQFIPNKGIIKKYKNEGKGVHIVKSIEDFHIPLWIKNEMIEWELGWDKVIPVVRSPRNWLASSIAAGGWANEYLDKVPEDKDVYPVNRITAYLSYLSPIRYMKIHYDSWHNNEKYRNSISSYFLKLKTTKMPRHCKFSSFGKNHDYTGDRYELLNDSQKKRFGKLFERM